MVDDLLEVVPQASESGHSWAFVDESYSHDSSDRAGFYLLGAAIIAQGDLEVHRQRMTELKPAGSAKLHWHDEGFRRRLHISRAIAKLSALHIVVIRSSPAGERTERQRRKCLQRLLFELVDLGVSRVVLESRGPADDKRDRNLVGAMRAQHQMRAMMRIEHLAGPRDPLLWIPDAVCGAVHAAKLGDTACLQILNGEFGVEVVDVGGA